MIPLRTFLGARFNAATDTLAVYVEHIPEARLQTKLVVQDSPRPWNTQQDCLLFGTADERKIFRCGYMPGSRARS